MPKRRSARGGRGGKAVSKKAKISAEKESEASGESEENKVEDYSVKQVEIEEEVSNVEQPGCGEDVNKESAKDKTVENSESIDTNEKGSATIDVDSENAGSGDASQIKSSANFNQLLEENVALDTGGHGITVELGGLTDIATTDEKSNKEPSAKDSCAEVMVEDDIANPMGENEKTTESTAAKDNVMRKGHSDNTECNDAVSSESSVAIADVMFAEENAPDKVITSEASPDNKNAGETECSEGDALKTVSVQDDEFADAEKSVGIEGDDLEAISVQDKFTEAEKFDIEGDKLETVSGQDDDEFTFAEQSAGIEGDELEAVSIQDDDEFKDIEKSTGNDLEAVSVQDDDEFKDIEKSAGDDLEAVSVQDDDEFKEAEKLAGDDLEAVSVQDDNLDEDLTEQAAKADSDEEEIQYVDEEADEEQNLLDVMNGEQRKKEEVVGTSDEKTKQDVDNNKFEEISEGSINQAEQEEVMNESFSDVEIIGETFTSEKKKTYDKPERQTQGKEAETLEEVFFATENDHSKVTAEDKDNDSISDDSLSDHENANMSLEEISDDDVDVSKKKKSPSKCESVGKLKAQPESGSAAVVKDSKSETKKAPDDAGEKISDTKEANEEGSKRSSPTAETSEAVNTSEKDKSPLDKSKDQEDDAVFFANICGVKKVPKKEESINLLSKRSDRNVSRSSPSESQKAVPDLPQRKIMMNAACQTAPHQMKGKIVQCTINPIKPVEAEQFGISKTSSKFLDQFRQKLPFSIPADVITKITSLQTCQENYYSLGVGPITFADMDSTKFRDNLLKRSDKFSISFDQHHHGIYKAQVKSQDDVAVFIRQLKSSELGNRYLTVSLSYGVEKVTNGVVNLMFDQDIQSRKQHSVKGDAKLRAKLQLSNVPDGVSKDFVRLLFPEALSITSGPQFDNNRSLFLGFSSTALAQEILLCHDLVVVNGRQVNISASDYVECSTPADSLCYVKDGSVVIDMASVTSEEASSASQAFEEPMIVEDSATTSVSETEPAAGQNEVDAEKSITNPCDGSTGEAKGAVPTEEKDMRSEVETVTVEEQEETNGLSSTAGSPGVTESMETSTTKEAGETEAATGKKQIPSDVIKAELREPNSDSVLVEYLPEERDNAISDTPFGKEDEEKSGDDEGKSVEKDDKEKPSDVTDNLEVVTSIQQEDSEVLGVHEANQTIEGRLSEAKAADATDCNVDPESDTAEASDDNIMADSHEAHIVSSDSEKAMTTVHIANSDLNEAKAIGGIVTPGSNESKTTTDDITATSDSNEVTTMDENIHLGSDESKASEVSEGKIKIDDKIIPCSNEAKSDNVTSDSHEFTSAGHTITSNINEAKATSDDTSSETLTSQKASKNNIDPGKSKSEDLVGTAVLSQEQAAGDPVANKSLEDVSDEDVTQQDKANAADDLMILREDASKTVIAKIDLTLEESTDAEVRSNKSGTTDAVAVPGSAADKEAGKTSLEGESDERLFMRDAGFEIDMEVIDVDSEEKAEEKVMYPTQTSQQSRGTPRTSRDRSGGASPGRDHQRDSGRNEESHKSPPGCNSTSSGQKERALRRSEPYRIVPSRVSTAQRRDKYQQYGRRRSRSPDLSWDANSYRDPPPQRHSVYPPAPDRGQFPPSQPPYPYRPPYPVSEQQWKPSYDAQKPPYYPDPIRSSGYPRAPTEEPDRRSGYHYPPQQQPQPRRDESRGVRPEDSPPWREVKYNKGREFQVPHSQQERRRASPPPSKHRSRSRSLSDMSADSDCVEPPAKKPDRRAGGEHVSRYAVMKKKVSRSPISVSSRSRSLSPVSGSPSPDRNLLRNEIVKSVKQFLHVAREIHVKGKGKQRISHSRSPPPRKVSTSKYSPTRKVSNSPRRRVLHSSSKHSPVPSHRQKSRSLSPYSPPRRRSPAPYGGGTDTRKYSRSPKRAHKSFYRHRSPSPVSSESSQGSPMPPPSGRYKDYHRQESSSRYREALPSASSSRHSYGTSSRSKPSQDFMPGSSSYRRSSERKHREEDKVKHSTWRDQQRERLAAAEAQSKQGMPPGPPMPPAPYVHGSGPAYPYSSPYQPSASMTHTGYNAYSSGQALPSSSGGPYQQQQYGASSSYQHPYVNPGAYPPIPGQPGPPITDAYQQAFSILKTALGELQHQPQPQQQHQPYPSHSYSRNASSSYPSTSNQPAPAASAQTKSWSMGSNAMVFQRILGNEGGSRKKSGGIELLGDRGRQERPKVAKEVRVLTSVPTKKK